MCLSGWVQAWKSKGRQFDSQSRAHAWVAGQVRSKGERERQLHIDISLLSPSLPLSKK